VFQSTVSVHEFVAKISTTLKRPYEQIFERNLRHHTLLKMIYSESKRRCRDRTDVMSTYNQFDKDCPKDR